jgi:hypothetical protein
MHALTWSLSHIRPWQVRDIHLVTRLKESLYIVVGSASLAQERGTLRRVLESRERMDTWEYVQAMRSIS